MSYYNSTPCFVYFMATDDRFLPIIKIGYSWKPELRKTRLKKTLRRPLKIIATIKCAGNYEARKLEKSIHFNFEWLRIDGEWFLSHQKLITYIESEVARG